MCQDSFPADKAIVFHVVNARGYPHEFAAFQLAEGTTAEDLVQGEASGETRFIGAAFALPDQEASDLVLVDLEPGIYAVVCFIDIPEGIPHVARGMFTEFMIQQPNNRKEEMQ